MGQYPSGRRQQKRFWLEAAGERVMPDVTPIRQESK
jgi:hypothetical protein